jgi:ATP-dependent DNA helicase DinG
MRKEASGAQIIVVNHHLLFADLAARYQGAGYENAVVLPPFNRLIIDEAHTIENAATSFFSGEFSCAGIFRQLSRLYHQRRASKRGLLVKLCALLPSSEDPLDSLAAGIRKIRSLAEKLDECALEFCGVEGLYRLSPDQTDESALKKTLFPHFNNLRKTIASFTSTLREITENLDDEASSSPVVWEIKTIARRMENVSEICGVFCKYRKYEDEVLWMEKVRLSKEPQAVFTRTPLDLSPRLKDCVFSVNKTVICVSATLAINNDFSFWAERCGVSSLENRSVLYGCFPSPFPYSSAVLLASPSDAPLPDEEDWQEFINKSACGLAAVSGGSALVLFTSYQSLSSAHSAAKSELAPLGIRCLKQGDDDRTRLLQDFVSDTRSCLFATDSFWEGVDAPGDTLRLVIICRLPFRTPGDPVFEARSEAVQKRGGSPFMELSLPAAVMKFKQGFGRLIRKSTDRGVIAILDSRLSKKRYGQIFIDALPETKLSFTNFDNILKDVENFLY